MLRYCPYCLEKFSKKDLGFKCVTSGKVFSSDVWKSWKKQGQLPICPGGYNESGCSGCKGKALSQRVCGKCEHELSNLMVKNDNLQISIVGTQSAGKTIYINMLLKTMRDRFGGAGFGKIFLPVQASEGDMVDAEINNMEHGLLPPGTTSVNVKPRLYQCGVGAHMDILTFFDGAGEDFANEALQATLHRYVNVSDGIILLFDPTSIPAVNKKLRARSNITSQLSRTTLEEALRGASLTYQRIQDWNRGWVERFFKSKISIPCAVVFSKFDLVFSLFEQSGDVLKQSKNLDHGNRFDEKDSQTVSQEIRNWLEENGCGAFLREIESDFKSIRYFGVSSLGGAPGTQENPKKYTPHRIADPLLWLMSKNGII